MAKDTQVLSHDTCEYSSTQIKLQHSMKITDFWGTFIIVNTSLILMTSPYILIENIQITKNSNSTTTTLAACVLLHLKQ